MSTTSEPISPSEEDLNTVLTSLKKAHPALGINKLHALLLSENPSWTVSEKRLRRILKNNNSNAGTPILTTLQSATPTGGGGLASSSSSSGSETVVHRDDDGDGDGDGDGDAHMYPSSTLVEGLDVSRWTRTIEVKYFDKKKGKGLVAKEPISEGQVVWKEDPFIIAPEWEIYDLQLASRACAHCTTPLTNRHLSSLVLHCPTTSSTTLSACPARFCNRLCLKRSEKTHPLLCPAQNPASVPLLAFAKKHAWMALHALAQCAARLLLAHQQKQGRQRAGGGGGGGSSSAGSGDGEREGMREDWSVFFALADLGMEERVKGGWLHGMEPDRATWQAAHKVFVQAFVEPPDTTGQKKLAKILKRPPPKEVADALFTYDGFLHGLGRMSLNLEAHGALYTLHSHLNHSCTPNVSVRHLDQRSALSRITILAKCNIAVGEELVVTYVDPSLGVRERRSQLGAWGFGRCECKRCVEEEKKEGKSGEGEIKKRSDIDELERELKAGLGVV